MIGGDINGYMNRNLTDYDGMHGGGGCCFREMNKVGGEYFILCQRMN